MKVLVIASALLAVSAAQWASLGNPYGGCYGCGALGAAPLAAGYAAPYAAVAAPVPAVTTHQFHAQDELGAYSYGYKGALSAKTESKDALGGTSGAYTYIDANGLKQTVKYVADAAGFRAEATNLPVAPIANLAAPVMTLVGPAPVADTAEVMAAKAEFAKLFAEAATRAAKEPEMMKERRKRNVAVPMDTPAVMAAKAEHAALYNAAALRAKGMIAPIAMRVPLDTPAVMAAKANHAMLYNAAALRANGMAAPMPMRMGMGVRMGMGMPMRMGLGVPMDTPAVMAAKAKHAALYNAAALRAAAAPDFSGWNNGLAMRGAWGNGLAMRGAWGNGLGLRGAWGNAGLW